jgi:membrane protein
MVVAQAAYRRSGRGSARRQGFGIAVVAADVRDAFVEHNLLTYAAAVAFQMILALLPLAFLGLALLGALGLGHLWTDTLVPGLHGRVPPDVYRAVDSTGELIVSTGTAATIAVAGLLSIWYLTAAVRAVMEALNKIHDVVDERQWWLRGLIAVGLGAATGAAGVGSFLLVTWGSTVGGAGAVALDIGRWLGAVVLLCLVVALLVRVAPAEHPQPRWASVCSILVVVSWIVATLLFKLWVTDVIDLKTPTGVLAGLLALAAWIFVTAAVFLVGVQLDETLRKLTAGRARGLLGWL